MTLSLFCFLSVFDEYLKISGKPIEASIRGELSGDFEKLMLAVGELVLSYEVGSKEVTLKGSYHSSSVCVHLYYCTLQTCQTVMQVDIQSAIKVKHASQREREF